MAGVSALTKHPLLPHPAITRVLTMQDDELNISALTSHVFENGIPPRVLLGSVSTKYIDPDTFLNPTYHSLLGSLLSSTPPSPPTLFITPLYF